MRKITVYVDGQAGTTGLQIVERLKAREDITLLRLDDAERHNEHRRAQAMAQADFTFLCLPDEAAREAVKLAGTHTRILDASTAHRTCPGWDYGFPELTPDARARIAKSRRVAVPGCYATGFLSIVSPLVQSGIMPPDFPVTAYGLSGYSGAGKKGIAQYESPERPAAWESPRLYALSLRHKHLPEMQKYAGLMYPPLFTPLICDYYSGMTVCVPMQTRQLAAPVTVVQVNEMYRAHYEGAPLVEVKPVMEDTEQSGYFLASGELAGQNRLEIFTFGNEEQLLLCARLDNLGKGASGAAVQCMNLMMGVPETTGLL